MNKTYSILYESLMFVINNSITSYVIELTLVLRVSKTPDQQHLQICVLLTQINKTEAFLIKFNKKNLNRPNF